MVEYNNILKETMDNAKNLGADSCMGEGTYYQHYYQPSLILLKGSLPPLLLKRRLHLPASTPPLPFQLAECRQELQAKPRLTHSIVVFNILRFNAVQCSAV